jgi:hypothetical protein
VNTICKKTISDVFSPAEKPRLLGDEVFFGGEGRAWKVSSAEGLAYLCVSQIVGTRVRQREWILWMMVASTWKDVVAHIVLRLIRTCQCTDDGMYDVPSRCSDDLHRSVSCMFAD